MNIEDEQIRNAVNRTEIIKLPKRRLATFGTTNIHYYLVTEPSYTDLDAAAVNDTVIREGRVVAEPPRIVTPYYLSRIEGFSKDARRYLDLLIDEYGSNAPGLFYTYRNEPTSLNIVSEDWLAVAGKISADIDQKGDPLSSIIKGEDKLWDVSLMKFIYEMTRTSMPDNLRQLGSHGLLDDAGGVPVDVRLRIDQMFGEVQKGDREPRELKEELDRWGLFPEYEDTFFKLFKKRAK